MVRELLFYLLLVMVLAIISRPSSAGLWGWVWALSANCIASHFLFVAGMAPPGFVVYVPSSPAATEDKMAKYHGSANPDSHSRLRSSSCRGFEVRVILPSGSDKTHPEMISTAPFRLSPCVGRPAVSFRFAG